MSWNQLLSILKDARKEGTARKGARPLACPNDGEPLREGPDGILFCRFDGWQWPKDKESAIT